MIEDLGGPVTSKRLEFGSDTGIRVRVEIENAPNVNWTGRVIESAMINHCHLYPINRPAEKWGKDRPYWLMGLYGLVPLVLAAAFLYWMIGLPPASIMDQPGFKETFFYVMPAVFIPFSVGTFLFMEWKSRRFRRKSQRVAEQYR